MSLGRLSVLSVLLCSASQVVGQASVDGLVEVRSRYLDKVQLRPLADFAAYKQVLIEPAPIKLRVDANINDRNPRRMPPEQAKEISDAAAEAMNSALVQAFKARGYEIAAAPGPGVLRLSPSVPELVINAPSGGPATRSYTTEAGEAKLALEVRDASSNSVLALIAHKGDTTRTGLRMTDQTTNRFWFEALFNRWAADCAEALKSPAKD
jgi:uncharacterized protein DUF3313